jgi:hypothetical protein
VYGVKVAEGGAEGGAEGIFIDGIGGAVEEDIRTDGGGSVV